MSKKKETTAVVETKETATHALAAYNGKDTQIGSLLAQNTLEAIRRDFGLEILRAAQKDTIERVNELRATCEAIAEQAKQVVDPNQRFLAELRIRSQSTILVDWFSEIAPEFAKTEEGRAKIEQEVARLIESLVSKLS